MVTNRLSPSGTKISWQGPVGSFGNLPLLGNLLGEARVALDAGAIWVWNGIAWVNASSADELVKVTEADTTPNYLSPKIAAGAGITLAVLNPGANEQVQITATAPSGSLYQTDEFVAAAAQTFFVLSFLPTDIPNMGVFVSGVRYNLGSSYAVAALILTWLNAPFVMSAGDNVIVTYQR